MVVLWLIRKTHFHITNLLNTLLTLAPVPENPTLLHLVVELFEILLAHEMILFDGETSILEEITKNALECNYYNRALHLVHSSFKEMTVCSFVVLWSGWQQMHFEFMLICQSLLLCR